MRDHVAEIAALLETPRGRAKGRRRIHVAGLCVALASSCWAASAVAEPLDTSHLPHVADAKEIYASAPTSIYAVPETVAETAEATDKALAADGWRQYLPPNAEQLKSPDQQILTYKKGPQAVTVMVTTPPGGAKTANVNYVATLLATDLPFPADATTIAYNPDTPYLSCVSAQPVLALRDFFSAELTALGWTAAPPAPGAKPATADDRKLRAFFVRADHQPLMLVLERGDDGKTAAELKSVSPEFLAAISQPPKAAEAPAQAPKAAAPAKAASASDDLSDSLTKQAELMAAEAKVDALAGAKAPAPPAPSGASQTLGALQGGKASIPLPETAEDIDYDGAEGKLEFNAASSVKAVAAFYRAAMAPLGWKEQPSVINRDNMVELEFSKAGKEFSLTIMRMGKTVNVTGDGAGLKDAAAEAAADAAAAAPQELEAEETGGLPVPTNHTMSGAEATPFRHGLNANVPANLASVLAFYRRELTKRGWKEPDPAEISATAATVAFVSPDGPAILKLAFKDDETIVSLVVRDRAKAEKAGMAPKAGQVKMMFGNMMGADAVFTINKQTIKVVAGAGAKGANGPTIDLPPGKYKVVVKVAGQAAATQEAIVAADETWGLLVGPGGVLPLQMY